MEITVAVLGTGIMGAPMVRRLAAAGAHVRAWNRTGARAEALAGPGVPVAEDPASAVHGADAVLTMLADDAALRAVVAAARPALHRGLLWVQTSTVSPATMAELGDVASAAGVQFVDAPVLGTRRPAERGELVVLASGPDAARPATDALLEPLAQTIRWVGDVGAGTALKLVVNHWIVGLVGLPAETLDVAAATGVGGAAFFDAIDGSAMAPPYVRLKGDATLAGEHPPSFPLRLAVKDVGVVRDALGAGGPPVLEAVAARYEAALAAGHGDEDLAAVARVTGRDPDLDRLAAYGARVAMDDLD